MDQYIREMLRLLACAGSLGVTFVPGSLFGFAVTCTDPLRTTDL